jgi:uncharacterized heparinase superfamily protein
VGVCVQRGWDRWQLYRLAFREIGRDLKASVRRLRSGPRLGSATPSRLLFAPQDLRTGDPTVAQDIYAGYFVFAGRAVQAGGRSPFAVLPPSSSWSEGLHGFGWLRHLRAADTALARENARALVSEGIAFQRRARAPEARATRVVSRRLISFLSQSPLVLTGADHGFYRDFLRAIGTAVRDLERGVTMAPRPADRISAAIALCYAGLCCGGYEAQLRRATRALKVEIDAQILADGGHISRNPGMLIEILLDLLPLRQVFVSRGIEPPEELDRAIERMLPMLRLFRHGDGELALFNGMGRTEFDLLVALVAYDSVRGQPAQRATYSGYDRVEVGTTVLIADLGPAPPLEASAEAHAGCLSFELSSGPHRLVVNCGVPSQDGPLRQAVRATAAHTTLGIGNTASCLFLAPRPDMPGGRIAAWLARRLGRIALSGPREVRTERQTEADGTIQLVASHDGYRDAFGFRHERRLRLSPGGTRLDGEDILIADGKGAATPDPFVRFHLHPRVTPVREHGRNAVTLTQPDGTVWRFSVVDSEAGSAGALQEPDLAIEDSIFFADVDGRRPTRQIVVRPGRDGSGNPAALAWRFERAETV